MSKEGQINETPAQAEMLSIAKFKAQHFRQTTLPAVRQMGAQMLAANEQGSFERTHAAGAAQTDTAAAFGGANEALTKQAAASGTQGSARSKLDTASLGDAQAASAGFATVAADQSQADKYVSGLGALTQIGQGQEATALGGMAQSAQLGGQQAAQDAELALQDKIGKAGLVGQAVGTGIGLWGGGGAAANTDDYRGSELPYSLRGGKG